MCWDVKMVEADNLILKRAKRLRIARALSGLTREAFSKKHSISVFTLRSCELGHLAISHKTARKISNALQEEKILCTTEWIMEGKGQTPTFHHCEAPHKNLSLLSEEDLILQEINLFKKSHTSAVVWQLQDNAMAPVYRCGDFIGGQFIENHDQLIGKTCLIETQPNHFILRKITKDNNKFKPWILSALNLETRCCHYLRLSKISSAALVLWTRRSLMSALI